ncbi:hypothetical protein C9I99_01195 [Photobacterium lutimaris]|uniref:Uncharacterized protein n=1 Tax=Photobacterium lutimaris TaxID=388278 RepID=A0A2T3J338_9GAMM|nr:hypothetical protein C9I99_01195 [Photobacterium lutimaris]TDR78722.1 hypothetical protein DFP78_101235 [Photobacterium lutimaris]
MIRAYAYLSKNKPHIHKLNITLTFLIFAFCCYQLLANEKVTFGLGLFFVGIMVTLFSKASSYRQKYLSND